ncbi:helix-turn-helix domain-containing protein [Streptomyces sp. NPDC048639]|uniref:AraC family transcriptional regulator n=1 Tax=Streptomyces sp. NPDC048639 TaxID=3365581 RepID=UPI003722258B
MAGRPPTVDAAAGLPAPAVRPYVRRYLGYRYLGFPPGVHVGLPSAWLTVVISLDEPTRVAQTPGAAATAYAALAGGLDTRPVAIAHDGDQYGVQLELSPLGCRGLLGLPAAGLARAVADLPDLLGQAPARELAERMAEGRSWASRFAVLDEVLGRAIRRDAGAPAAEVERAWRCVRDSGGAVGIGEMAAEIGWSRRHLTARFTAEFGLTPKDVARVVRFERAKRLLSGTARPGLAETAVACGYYDQAHLARDWRELAGMPPSAWLAAGDLPPVEFGTDAAASVRAGASAPDRGASGPR